MNNKAVGIIIALLVIIGGIYLLSNTNTTTTSGATGKVVFSVSDAAIDMSSISEVDMTMSSVSVFNQEKGWVNIPSGSHTYNLLDLNAKNEAQIFADFKVPAGTYTMARLSVDKIIVKTKAGATKEAKLPSNELKVNTILVVTGDATSTVNFDFLADKSLHMTGNGGYIFAPVVKTTSRSDADVSVSTNGSVHILGGHVDSDETEGMDIDGSVKVNFELNSNQKFNVVNGVIQASGTGILNY